MKKFHRAFLCVGLICLSLCAGAQYRTDLSGEELAPVSDTVVLTLDQALKIALSENVAVKVADQEILRSEYAKRGSYASLFPQINASGSFQRTIKKQVMYMGGDGDGGGMAGMFTDIMSPVYQALGILAANQGVDISSILNPPADDDAAAASSGDGGIAVGRLNTYNAGISASMPIVNAQLWQSLKISGQGVELAVEQARASRLDMVTQVKQAYFAVLFAKQAFNVYKSVYENALVNFESQQRRYKVQKASDLELTRASSAVANAIPNVYNAESNVILALWQLKAVMGIDLDSAIDVAGSLDDYAVTMFRDIHESENASLENNTNLRQLAIQAEQLAATVKMQQYAYLPSLALSFSYSMNAMTNDFKFSEYRWTPYSFIGLSLSIPIFSGGQRYHAIRQTRVQQTELDLQRLNVERQLKIGIRQYLNTMETAMKSYDAAGEAVSLARKAYDVTSKSFEVGKSTQTELNDAQLALTQAELARSQAVYNFVVAKAGLEQTIGADFIDEYDTPELK